MALHAYLPQDRLRALANKTTLPDRTSGSALFADISGFTAFTDGLRSILGPRRGAEELTQQIEAIYSALIKQIELFGGSVIDFAGDSMLCWFESLDGASQSSSAHCAIASGMALQREMLSFTNIILPDQSTTALTVKVAIASGTAQRFIVGDPQIHVMDVITGATIARTATAEHLARKGEVIIDEATVTVLGDKVTIQDWRDDLDGGDRFAVVAALTQSLTPLALKEVETRNLTPEVFHPWLHPELIEREVSGGGSLLTEFRPCVALFVRFLGIDYEVDGAGMQLDQFVRETQAIAARRGGTFLQITIGDKGSYAYINFGVLEMHEDDPRRAVITALELRELAQSLGFLQPLQIGITQGTMRVGAYGGETRKTFGALSDEVNLAARLMTSAEEGEIVLSSQVHKAVMNDFICESCPPLSIKGKEEPFSVFAVTGESQRRPVRLQEPNYSLPMVGRQEELALIEEKLDLAIEGRSQVISIVAEAGLGKSRLVAEVIRTAHRKGFVGFGGACQSDGIHTPYLAWKSIWGAFFNVDPEMPLQEQMRSIESEIEDHAPSRLEAMPLLNVVLDLNIPENDFTKNLEPKIRQSALHALFEDCLKSQAGDEPTLIVIEDLHWIDALSHELLEGLAKALANYAACFVLAYRPPQLQRLQAPRLELLPQFTEIELHELTITEAESAIRAKLAQLYPARGALGGTLPEGLVDALMRSAQGNPFYLEELLNYLRDRGIDLWGLGDLTGLLDLPDSLHTLILSRIDQLSEHEKTTLRVASIVGRLFRANWLTGYYPELGSFPHVKAALNELDKLDITPLDSPEPELMYLFKHIVTHEVTYESLPYATRARLHDQLAGYLESIVGATRESPLLDTITFHYLRSENKEKQIEYLRKAGEASQKNYANDAALEYYGLLLPVLNDDKEKTQIHLKRGQVSFLMGRYAEAESDYQLALDSTIDDAALKARAQYALGKLNLFRGNYEPALEWLAKAKETHTTLKDNTGLAQILIEIGWVFYRKGEYKQARQSTNEGLALARDAGDKLITASALTNMGFLASDQGDYVAARVLQLESLALRREMDDKHGVAMSLLNLGRVTLDQGDYVEARTSLEESLVLLREMNAKEGIATSLGNLGHVTFAQTDYSMARATYEESLSLYRSIEDKLGIADALMHLGNVAIKQGNYSAARTLYEESQSLFREIGNKGGSVNSLLNLGNVALAQGEYATARAVWEESLELLREMGIKRNIAGSLIGLGTVAYLQGEYATARTLLEESLVLCKEMDQKTLMAYALLNLGLVDLVEDKPEARQRILHSLRLRVEMGEQLEQTSSLIGTAELVLQEGNPQFATGLLGAVESALKGLSAVMEPEMKPLYDDTLVLVKETLGDAAFQSAWEEGVKWTLEDTVKRALGE